MWQPRGFRSLGSPLCRGGGLLPPLGLAGVGVTAAGAAVVVDAFAEDAIFSNVRMAGARVGGPGVGNVRRRPHVGEGARRGGRVEGLHVGWSEIGSSRNVEDNLEKRFVVKDAVAEVLSAWSA